MEIEVFTLLLSVAFGLLGINIFYKGSKFLGVLSGLLILVTSLTLFFQPLTFKVGKTIQTIDNSTTTETWKYEELSSFSQGSLLYKFFTWFLFVLGIFLMFYNAELEVRRRTK